DTGNELKALRGHAPRPITAIAVSPDSKWIASGDDSKTIRIWEAESGKEIQKLDGTRGSVESLAFSADGKRLAYGGTAQKIFVHDTLTGELRLEIPTRQQRTAHAIRVNSLAYSSDGRWIVSAGSDRKTCLWKADSGEPVNSPIQSLAGPVAFAPDSQVFAV